MSLDTSYADHVAAIVRNERCKHGHLWIPKNTRWVRRTDGRTYRQCRKCQYARLKLRYRTDESYREKVKARVSARYYARKAEHVQA